MNDGELETAYYVGAAGYNMTEIRDWLAEVAAATAARRCLRQATRETRNGGTLEDNFVRTCLEDETGSPYPEPIFQDSYSNLGLDEVGESPAGLAMGIAIYNVPDVGTVASFVAGGFYAQGAPMYGAFIGCGAAIGFTSDLDNGTAGGVCVGAEYY